MGGFRVEVLRVEGLGFRGFGMVIYSFIIHLLKM